MGLYDASETAAGVKAKVATLGALYRFGLTTFKAGWGLADVAGVKKERLASPGASDALEAHLGLR